MSIARSFKPRRLAILLAVAALSLPAAACGRSSNVPTGAASEAVGASSPTPAAPAPQSGGNFGSLSAICRPGSASGGAGRGISADAIRIGVLGDPGAAAAPGLGQEFFDAADAFSKWCNAAGGINGRKIVVDKLDAKLFDGGAAVIKACQRDFMLVGGGNGLDAPDVRPRLGCELGAIPAYTVSPEATKAGLQVSPAASKPTVYDVGPMRLLAEAYPETKTGLGIAGSTLASLAPQGLRAREAWEKLGYKASVLQPRPALIDNYRPWLEQMKVAAAKADYEIVATDPSPIFNGMSNVGFKPQWVLFGQTFYSPKSVQAAKAARYLPNSYVAFKNLPFELAAKYPVVQQVKDIMEAGAGTGNLDNFTALAFNSWTLWAQSATACGSELTQNCILEKAAAQHHWDAGGLFAPVDVDPRSFTPSDCVVVMRLTTSGWVYDEKVTAPNNGAYNCGPDNLATVKSYE